MTGDASCTSTSPGIRPAVGSSSSYAKHFPISPLPGSSSSITTRSTDWKSPLRSPRWRSPVCGPRFEVPGRTELRSAGWEAARYHLLDHIIALNKCHLKRLLADYVRYYHEDPTHMGLQKQTT